jgi:hypothetical protein
MIEMKDLTGDHADDSKPGHINAVTRSQTRQSLMSMLSKESQHIISLNVRKFDGVNANEAEKWIKDIEEWIKIADLSFKMVFDMMLVDEAATLWIEFQRSETKEFSGCEIKEWFLDTFTLKKSMIAKIVELSEVRQGDEERFATFEIRVRKLINSVLHSGLNEEEIVQDVIKNRIRDNKMKEIMITKPEITMKETRNLAKIYENMERSDKVYVNAVQRPSYANAAKKPVFKRPDNYRPVYQERRENRSQTISDEENNYRNIESQQRSRYRADRNEFAARNNNDGFKRPYENKQSMNTERRMPTISMKQIAKRVYNTSRGLYTPKEESLKEGQCFCCGETDHRRFECPLKNKCLICGDENHTFRNCHLLRGNKNIRRVACVYEDENESEITHINEAYAKDDDSVSINEDRRRKNREDSTVYISSVGSRN